MPHSKQLLAALRDLRRSITAEAAQRIEHWQRDISSRHSSQAPAILRTTWRSATTICVNCSVS